MYKYTVSKIKSMLALVLGKTEQTLVGRITGGRLTDLTITQIKTLLGIDDVFFYYPDYTETDQGVEGGGKTVKTCVDTIATDSATIVFRHDSGAATTTYTFSTDETIPANINLEIEKGAILSIDAAKTITINGPFGAGRYQVFNGDGNADFSSGNAPGEMLWFGYSTDIGAPVNKAIAAGLLDINIPAGAFDLLTKITKPAYVNIHGGGIAATIITKKADIVGIEITGGYGELKNFQLNSDGTDTTNTSDGILATSAPRDSWDNVEVLNQGGCGIRYISGNLLNAGFLVTISNGVHGFYVDGTDADTNGGFIKFLDTRGNAGDGFKIDNSWGKSWTARIISQTNTGTGINIDTVQGNWMIYAESNTTAQSVLGSNADGNYVINTNGFTTDNGEYNTVHTKIHTTGKLAFQSLFAKSVTFYDHLNYIGTLNFTVTADKEYTFSTSGSSADQAIKMENSVAGKVTNLTADGTITSGRAVLSGFVTIPDGGTTVAVSGGNVFTTANTGATAITDFTSGVTGQIITIILQDSNTTISDGGNLKLAGSANFTGGASDTLTLVMSDVSNEWCEISRSNN